MCVCVRAYVCVLVRACEGVHLNIFEAPVRLHALSEKDSFLSWSLLRTLVIGGRLWLLSRAALPVLNKNFVLSGWWAQRSTRQNTHAHRQTLTRMYAQTSQCKDLLQYRDLTLLHSLPILFHSDLHAVTR